LGLIAIWLGGRFNLPQLRVADPIAALAVAAFVVSISARLGRRTIDALLDAAPKGSRAQVIAAVESAAGVVAANRVRIRNRASKFFVDANISVERTIPFDHVPAVISAVRARVRDILPDADVMIHSEPQAPRHENLFEKVQWIARRSNLAVHDLVMHDVDR